MSESASARHRALPLSHLPLSTLAGAIAVVSSGLLASTALPAAAAPSAATQASVSHAGTAARQSAATGSGVLRIAARYKGIAYRWGGTTPRGFDCAGFTQYVYRQMGKKLPRTVAAQRRAVHRVPRSQARPGDLVFFGTSHVGIYAGGNLMIDSPRTGKSISLREIYTSRVQFGRI